MAMGCTSRLTSLISSTRREMREQRPSESLAPRRSMFRAKTASQVGLLAPTGSSVVLSNSRA